MTRKLQPKINDSLRTRFGEANYHERLACLSVGGKGQFLISRFVDGGKLVAKLRGGVSKNFGLILRSLPLSELRRSLLGSLTRPLAQGREESDADQTNERSAAARTAASVPDAQAVSRAMLYPRLAAMDGTPE